MLELLTGFALNVWTWLLLAIGLGLVIFVHELGHFAVAKWVGVMVERFSIGFGPVLWSFRRGETEYAISAIPFGGYVKMLGQDDNPANTARERERTMLKGSAADDAAPDQAGASESANGQGGTSSRRTVATAEELVEYTEELDPRSYPAKSVPQRMAIISAGVIMNLIFGLILFIFVFNVGVPYTPAWVGAVEPGGPAWQAGIEPGDKILRVDGEEVVEFEQFHQAVVLSDGTRSLEVEAARGDRVLTFQVQPRMEDSAPDVGIGVASDLVLRKTHPVAEGFAAARPLQGSFQGGDRITHVDGQRVEWYAEFVSYLAAHAHKEVRITVARRSRDSSASEESVDVVIPPQYLRDLGIRFQMGKVTGVQVDSPAARAGIQVGDVLRTVADQPCDPLRLPELIAGHAGRAIEIEVKRESQGEQNLRFTVVPDDKPAWMTPPRGSGDPLTLPGLGIAYQLVPAITEQPHADSPAGRAGLQKDDWVTAAVLIVPPDSPDDKEHVLELAIKDEEQHQSLPNVFWRLQHEPKAMLKLKVKRDGKPFESEPFVPEFDATRPAPIRGLGLNAVFMMQMEPQGFSRAIVLGYRTTKSTMTTVYLMLRRLIFNRTVSPKNLVGPVGIVQMGHYTAQTDVRWFIKFMAMLSVNLAIINFLPIPVLDGGHMVLLSWEAIRGKPASERVVIAANYCGLLLILSLALFVTWNDIARWIR